MELTLIKGSDSREVKISRTFDRCDHDDLEYTANSLSLLCKKCDKEVSAIAVLEKLLRKDSFLRQRMLKADEIIKSSVKQNKTKCEYCKKMTRIKKLNI